MSMPECKQNWKSTGLETDGWLKLMYRRNFQSKQWMRICLLIFIITNYLVWLLCVFTKRNSFNTHAYGTWHAMRNKSMSFSLPVPVQSIADLPADAPEAYQTHTIVQKPHGSWFCTFCSGEPVFSVQRTVIQSYRQSDNLNKQKIGRTRVASGVR